MRPAADRAYARHSSGDVNDIYTAASRTEVAAVVVRLYGGDHPWLHRKPRVRALRKFLESQVHQLEEADAVAVELTERLTQIQLKGRWYDSDKSVAARQEQLRAQVLPPRVDDDTEIRYLMTSSGQIVQVIPSDEADQTQTALDK